MNRGPQRSSSHRRVVGSHVLALVSVALVSFAQLGPARAQPADDVGPVEADTQAALPDAPEGFVSEQVGAVIWEHHARAASVVHDLKEVYRDEWPRVVAELGAEIDATLRIRIGRDPEEMAALAPVGAAPPPYASGVAYPQRGLVLLTLAAPETWERPDVASVLVHELSHIALHRAVNGQPAPRWFREGVAIHQAREHDLDRIRTLWSGTASGTLLSLEELSGAFPSRPHRVNLAYAQSADFVRWLRARDDGEARFRELVGRLRRGQPFETALERTYSIRMQSLEIEWHDDLSERFQAWPLLFGSGGLWVLASMLVVIAYMRRKRRDGVKLRQWEEEEGAMLEEIPAPAAPPVLKIELVPSAAADDEAEVLYVVPPEPRYRDSGVPTVEHDGRSHTLH